MLQLRRRQHAAALLGAVPSDPNPDRNDFLSRALLVLEG